MSRAVLAAASLVFLASPGHAKSTKWNIDPSHSEIGFSVRHLDIANIRGKFLEFAAVIEADEKTAKLSSLQATAETKSVDTGNSTRDKHLRADDFFDAAAHPQLKLRAQSFKWTGNKFKAVADLTIRDVTQRVVFAGELLGVSTVNFGDGEQLRAGYTATATINRREFGLRFNKLVEGVAVAGDRVKIAIDVELWRPVGNNM